MPRRATAWCLTPDTGPADMSCGEGALAAPAHQRECGPRQIAAGASERAAERDRRPLAVEAFPVADEDVRRLEPGERLPRRAQAQERVNAERFVAYTEVPDRSECVGDGEYPALGPPESNLAPEARAGDRAKLERRAGDGLGGRLVDRHAKAGGERVRVTPVAVEEDENRGRLAERPDPPVDAFALDRVDDVDAAVDRKRVRRASKRIVVGRPADAEVRLVEEPDRAQAKVRRTSPSPSTRRSTSSRVV
jgi:hypothetical protein